MTTIESNTWLDSYPDLKGIDDNVWQEVAKTAKHARFAGNDVIFNDGDDCENYLLIIEGSIKIKKTTSEGHEIILYHIKEGQTCELTTCCLLSGTRYTAQVATDTPYMQYLSPRTSLNRH